MSPDRTVLRTRIRPPANLTTVSEIAGYLLDARSGFCGWT